MLLKHLKFQACGTNISKGCTSKGLLAYNARAYLGILVVPVREGVYSRNECMNGRDEVLHGRKAEEWGKHSFTCARSTY